MDLEGCGFPTKSAESGGFGSPLHFLLFCGGESVIKDFFYYFGGQFSLFQDPFSMKQSMESKGDI